MFQTTNQIFSGTHDLRCATATFHRTRAPCDPSGRGWAPRSADPSDPAAWGPGTGDGNAMGFSSRSPSGGFPYKVVPPQWCERWFIIPITSSIFHPHSSTQTWNSTCLHQLNANELGHHLVYTGDIQKKWLVYVVENPGTSYIMMDDDWGWPVMTKRKPPVSIQKSMEHQPFVVVTQLVLWTIFNDHVNLPESMKNSLRD